MCSVTGRAPQKRCSLSCQRRHCGMSRTEPTRQNSLSLTHSTHTAPWCTRERIPLHSPPPWVGPSSLLYYTCLQLSCKKRDGSCRKAAVPGCRKEPSAPEESCAFWKCYSGWCVLKGWRLPGHGVSQAWEAPVDVRTPPKSRTTAKIVISLRKKWDNKGFSLLIPLMLQSKDVSLSREELLTG